MGMINKVSDAIKGHPVWQRCYTDGMSEMDMLRCLSQIIDHELDKPEHEMDATLIEQCSALMTELIPQGDRPTEQEMEDSLQSILASSPTGLPRPRKSRRSLWIKVVAIAAAIAIVASMSLSVIAVKQGYANAFEYVSDKFIVLFNLDTGIFSNNNGITVIRDSNSIKYTTIDELIIEENLDILYPSTLPEDIQIKQIRIIINNTGNEDIYFTFNNDLFAIKIRDICSDLDKVTNYSIYHMQGINYYVQPVGTTFQAICQHNGYEYMIIAKDRESLIFILDNMKENT